MNRLFSFGLMLLSCLCLLSCGGSDSTAPSPSSEDKKLFLAVYMVGSDLETRGGYATDDLLDMIAGYDHLNTAGQEGLEVLVAFGGSEKETWNGVRYADMDCLKRDSADGIFGNDSCYAYTAPISRSGPADMADPDTLIHFMNEVKAAGSGYDTVFIDFWDHGGSYLGYGHDENYDSMLSNTDIKEAFEKSGFRPDIIGFDACLMASAEVAGKLYPFADYIVAAEESEPGHGWDYEIVIRNYMDASNPIEYATSVVDGFIDSPAHAYSDGKTLSVIDTSAYGAFQVSLDHLAVQLDAVVAPDFSKLIKSAQNTEKYGSAKFSMDLAQYLTNLRFVFPALSSDIDDVSTRLSETVAYSRQDGSRPNANGLSIFCFDNDMWENGKYPEQRSASSSWYAFVESLMSFDDGDVTAPVLAVVDSSLCGKLPGDGTCYEISDDFAVKYAYSVLRNPKDPKTNTYELPLMRPLKWISGDYYFAGNANGKVLQVCSGANFCFTANAFVNEGMTEYGFKAIVQQRPSTVKARFDGGELVDYWVTSDPVPGDELDPKDDGTIEAGNLVIPFYNKLFFDAGAWSYSSNTLQVLPPFTEAPTFSLVDAVATTQEFIMVWDAQYNISLYNTSGAEQP